MGTLSCRFASRAAETARRALALVVAAALASGLSASLPDLLQHRHAVCLEHGELVHAGSTHDAPQALPESSDARGQHDGGKHEHCAVAVATLKSAVCQRVPQFVCLVADAGREPAPAPNVGSASSDPLYTLAPNHSPPRA